MNAVVVALLVALELGLHARLGSARDALAKLGLPTSFLCLLLIGVVDPRLITRRPAPWALQVLLGLPGNGNIVVVGQPLGLALSYYSPPEDR